MIISILVLMIILNNRNQVYKMIRLGKGQMGSALMGSLQISCFLTEGLLGTTYFYIPKSARACLFPQSVKFTASAAAPLAFTPFVRNQRLAARLGEEERLRAAAPQRQDIYIYIYIYRERERDTHTYIQL